MAEFVKFNNAKALKGNKSRNSLATAGRILFYFLIILLVFFLSWYIVFRSTHHYYEISGTSMMPTLNLSGSNTDAVYMSDLKGINRDEIVIIETSTGNIIKRAIGLSGDWVCLKLDEQSNLLYTYRITNSTFEEVQTYTSDDYKLSEPFLDEAISPDYVINANSSNPYYVSSHFSSFREFWTYFGSTSTINSLNSNLYDHDSVYYESKFYNKFIASGDYETASTLDGTIFVRIAENTIFYLGDNRAVSEDSRAKGAVPVANVIGVVDIIMRDAEGKNRFFFVVSYYFNEFINLFK